MWIYSCSIITFINLQPCDVGNVLLGSKVIISFQNLCATWNMDNPKTLVIFTDSKIGLIGYCRSFQVGHKMIAHLARMYAKTWSLLILNVFKTLKMYVSCFLIGLLTYFTPDTFQENFWVFWKIINIYFKSWPFLPKIKLSNLFHGWCFAFSITYMYNWRSNYFYEI